ncbi:MAG: glycosyltransferase family 2 protein [Micromonosporaceae bacterium]
MSPPDVSVIVPVYNTMPYLTRCLTSLLEQTIGLDRLQVVAVDDGSTDRSGRELDRFERRWPDVVTVIHQANSGGPAAPCNRALDVATGRYVFFVGADDYLGSDALRRLVDAADRYGSDVVLGKVVGVNSRFIEQDIFARTETDIGLFDSPLPRSLANTKLFRRELIERYGIRYPEQMPTGSDQPFTLAACYRARRISVLADYDFYFAVRRHNATNITSLSRHVERLELAGHLMTYATELIEPGKERAAMLAHYFDHNVAKLLEDDFLGLDHDTQQRVHAGVGRLAAEHLTDEIAERLGAETRIRIGLTRHGQLADLVAAIGQDATTGVPATLVEDGRWYACYPGFREPGRSLPDSCFDVTTAAGWTAKLDATALAWQTGDRGEAVLTITAHTPLPGDTPLPDDTPLPGAAPGAAPLAVSAEEIPAEVSTVSEGPAGTTLRIRFGVSELLARSNPTGQRRIVSARTGTDAPATALRAPRLGGIAPLVRRRGARLYVITPVRDVSGRLMISVVPFTPSRIAAYLRRVTRRWTASG